MATKNNHLTFNDKEMEVINKYKDHRRKRSIKFLDRLLDEIAISLNIVALWIIMLIFGAVWLIGMFVIGFLLRNVNVWAVLLILSWLMLIYSVISYYIFNSIEREMDNAKNKRKRRSKK